MRLPKFSLRKCFLLTLGFAVLVIFGISIRGKDFWKASRETQTIFDHEIVRGGDIDDEQLSIKFNEFNNHLNSNSKQLSSLLVQQKQPKGNVSAPPKPQTAHPKDPLDVIDYIQETDLPDEPPEFMGLPPISMIGAAAAAGKPWYFIGGKRYPVETKKSRRTNKRLARLLPSEDQRNDRITNQLMFVPPNYKEIRASGQFKKILLYNGLGPWNVKQGRDVFMQSKCPVNTCKITANRDEVGQADLVLYKDHFIPTGVYRPAKQIYMLYFLECPYHTQHIKFPDVFNWTSTYRKDSDVVAPYEKWEYYDPRVKQMEQDRNFALNKTKKVAWFVSNCGARNGRLQYAHELQKHIQVDIYGSCGAYKCSRSTADKCFEILDRDYKFYLAFENSNCKDYITEKFFVNSLNRNILPIVMGARPEDYEMGAPYRSYIHVDEFSSAKELADYLNILDKNDELYNSYFKWKGTGEFINTYFWCRVCALLHDESALAKPKWYEDVNEWWRGPGVCTNGSWRNFQARKDVMSED